MKQRDSSRLPFGGRRRMAFWTRAGIAVAGGLAVAAGGLLGAGGHRPAPLARHSAVQPAPPLRLVSTKQNAYWMVASDGGIFAFGAPFFGSTGNIKLNKPIVGMAASPDGQGYWFVASDGGIFAFPDGVQPFFGSMGAQKLNSPIVGMAATIDGGGYWLVAADGGIFAFGDAGFFGSLGGHTLPGAIVGMVASPTGGGYWLVGSDGSVYPFGDAGSFGSMTGQHLNAPVVAMAVTPDGGGYWLVAADGGVFAFGNAGFFGSTGNIKLNKPIVGMTASQTGRGYWFVASDGGLFAYGDAVFNGSMGNQRLNMPMVGMAAAPVLFPAHVSLVAAAGSVAADGVSQDTLVAQTLDQDGNPLPGDLLSFSVDTAGCGSISPGGGITDLNGEVTATYTSSSVAKGCQVSAGEDLGPLSGATTISQVAGGVAQIVGTPSTATVASADTGSSPGIPATFTVTDANGNPISGALIDFTTTLAHGSVTPTSGSTNGNGVVTTTLHDTKAESGVVTATAHSNSAVHGSTATITITGGHVASFSFDAPPASVNAGTPYTLTAHAVDSFGNAANPPSNQLAVSGTACDPAPDNTNSSCPAPTFSGGTATLHLTSWKAQAGAVATLSDSSAGATPGSTTGYTVVAGAPSKLTGSSTAIAPVFTTGTAPTTGIYIKAADANQAPTVTLTLTDAHGNVEMTNSDTVALTLTHNTASDGGSVPSTVALSHGVGSFQYTAPTEVSGAYPANNWGSGTLTWSDGNTITPVPALTEITTTNTATLTNATTGSPSFDFTADQVSNSSNQLQTVYTAASGTSALGMVQIDFTSAGFDTPLPSPMFTDCSGTGEAFAATSASMGSLGQLTMCAHPTRVNNPQGTSTGKVTGYVDGSYVSDVNSNSPTPTLTISAGAVNALTFTPAGPITVAADTAFMLDALAKDAEGNVVVPNETFDGMYSMTESGTCSGTPFASDAHIPNAWSATGHATLTGHAHIVHAGVVLTVKGAVHTGAMGTITVNIIAGAPATATWSTVVTPFTADQGNTGVTDAIDIGDGFCNPIGGQSVNLTTTLGHASVAQGGGPHMSFGGGTPPHVTTSTTNGSNGQAIGRAQFQLFDTTVETGTLTATAGAAMATSGTITITPGKVDSFSFVPVDMQAVDVAYMVTVHAADHFGNPTNPAHPVIDLNSTALGRAPNGDVPVATFNGPFGGSCGASCSNPLGTAVINTTSFLALPSASMTVKDTTPTDTFSGSTVQATSNGYAIATGPAAKVMATSTNADYTFSKTTATLALTSASEVANFTLTITDDRGNPISAAGVPTNQSDHVKITLTPGGTADQGKLSAPQQQQTPSDGSGTQTITVDLSGGTATFTYSGPLLRPLTGTGTITFTDLTDGTITGMPSAIDVTD